MMRFKIRIFYFYKRMVNIFLRKEKGNSQKLSPNLQRLVRESVSIVTSQTKPIAKYKRVKS